MSQGILAPPRICIENKRFYRVNLLRDNNGNQQQQQQQQQYQIAGASTSSQQNYQSTYLESDLYGEDYNEAKDDDDECHIEETSPSLYKLMMHVAPSFYGGIVGQKGATKKRIENETQTEIIVPSRIQNTNANPNTMVIVKGKTKSNVIAAKHKLNLLLTALRKRMGPTHFYGIALNSGEIRQNFNTLREEILSAKLPGIDESLFHNDCRLHVTFGVCTLMDNVEREKASKMLECCREFLDDLKVPFIVHVKGLQIMNDDPAATKVLYAAVNSPELQIFANRCYKYFNASPLSQEKFSSNNVKLHMTIMNNRKRCMAASSTNNNNNKMDNKQHSNSAWNMESFDAREILKRWSNYDFGSITCNELLLCVINPTNQDSANEFYKITTRLEL